MAEGLSAFGWSLDDPDLKGSLVETTVDGHIFYSAGCVAYTADQITPDTTEGVSKNDRARWPGGVVPYRFVDNFSDAEKRVFLDATELWTRAVGKNAQGKPVLRFVEDTAKTETLYLRVIRTGANNEASTGAVSGAYLKMVDRRPGTIAHELGHVLGLVHEHQRSDRDAFVRPTAEALANSQFAANFRKHGPREDTVRTAYDFGSIMHYPGSSPIGPGGAMVRVLACTAGHEAEGARMGQRTAPSAGDAEAIRAMYA